MKRITLIKTFAIACLLATSTIATAQVEFKLLTGFGTRFNDVNDNGIGVTQTQYYDFSTDALTDVEPEATGLVSINNNGDAAGEMFLDEANGIYQPAYKKNGTWNPIGWFPDADPAESGFVTYNISPNSKYVVGQMSKGCCDYGIFYYDTETNILSEIFDAGGEVVAGYTVNNNGIVGGWLDQPNNGGTFRVPAYISTDQIIHTIPEGTLPTISSDNFVSDINSSNIMVGTFDFNPFIYDLNTNTFTTFENPGGAERAVFSSISENGIAIGYATLDFGDREAIIYHPDLGPQPLFLKDVLADLGVTIDTNDGKLGTGYSISPDGNFVVGWVNGPPIFAEGWIVNLDNRILGTDNIAQAEVSFYPNPVKDMLNITSPNRIEGVNITNITGQKIENIVVQNNPTEVNFSAVSSGIYFVNVQTDSGAETFKIIKE